MKKPVYDHIFGQVSSHVGESELVRYWGTGLVLSALVFVVVYALLLVLSHLLWGSVSILNTLWHGFAGVAWLLSLGQFSADLIEFRLTLTHPVLLPVAMALSFGVAVALSGLLLKRLLKPRSNQRHKDGRQLREDEDAEKYARFISVPEKSKGVYDLHVGPHLVMSKAQLNRGLFLAGGPGSGKTVILEALYQDFTNMPGTKSIIYDMKGDFTSHFPKHVLVSPFDARSWIWDIAHDIQTHLQINNFTNALFPAKGGDKDFWQKSAAGVASSTCLDLYYQFGNNWGWRELEYHLTRDIVEHLATAKQHDRNTAMLINDPESQTASSIFSTLAQGTRVVSHLAKAWGDTQLLDANGSPLKRDDGSIRMKHRFSLMEWMKDDSDPTKDWSKAPRHIILRAGPDTDLTRTFVNAMLNVLTPELMSLPDNGEGRAIGIFLDEMPTLGKLDLGGLIETGRSKGIVNVWAFQAFEQMKDTYGTNYADALSAMVGNKIICEMGSGETRKKIAEQFGVRQVISIPHKRDAVAHEVGKAVVYEHTIASELGSYFKRGKWCGVKAIVETSGKDPMLLKFPGRVYQTKRKGLVRAYWTNQVPMSQTDKPDPVMEKHGIMTASALLKEFVVDKRKEHEDQQAYIQESNEFRENRPAIREFTERTLGMSTEEVEDFLAYLTPTYKQRFGTKVERGFIVD